MHREDSTRWQFYSERDERSHRIIGIGGEIRGKSGPNWSQIGAQGFSALWRDTRARVNNLNLLVTGHGCTKWLGVVEFEVVDRLVSSRFARFRVLVSSSRFS
jgi:hypothetical protein